MYVHTHKHNTHTQSIHAHKCPHGQYVYTCIWEHPYAHTQHIMLAYVQHTHHTHGHMPAQTTYNICVHMHRSTHTHTQRHTHGHKPPQTTYNIMHTCTCRHIQHTPLAHKSTHTYDKNCQSELTSTDALWGMDGGWTGNTFVLGFQFPN